MRKIDIEKNKKEFEELLLSINRDGVKELVEYLNGTDFFNAPASTKYHNSVEGGLCDHSLNVYHNLVEITKDKGFDPETLIICALLHDICKTYFYIVEMRNKKNDDGVWVKEPYYTVKDEMPLGHGEKSCFILSKFIKLTNEELYAIRWHMGGYEPKENYSYLGDAFNKYPLAVYLHVADLISTYISDSEGGEING